MTLVSDTIPATSPLPGVSLRTAMSRFFERAFTLRGRASRSEYWWWMLVNAIVMVLSLLVVPTLLTGHLSEGSFSIGPFGSLVFSSVTVATWSGYGVQDSNVAAFLSIVAGSWALFTAIPGVTVAVRRLHDSNLAGWWAFLAVIPFGALMVLGLALRGSRFEGSRFD